MATVNKLEVKKRQLSIRLKSGELVTPIFMPDATRAYVKSLSSADLLMTKTKAIVVNTFHNYLQPGLELIKQAGGIHAFSNWSGPILSDSGGFQIFSLIYGSKLGKINDDRVRFKSPLDGSWHDLSPEKSIQIQFDLGVDMMVCLDDCPPNDSSLEDLERSVKRTIAWAQRSYLEYQRQIKKRKLVNEQVPLLFAVIQGGDNFKLREHCALRLKEIGFAGYGFGGRPVDGNSKLMTDILQFTADLIPAEALRFALGLGTPADISTAYNFGWDLFDCVIPTREARHGRLFISKGALEYDTININNSRFKADFSKINPSSNFTELQTNSFSYLHHLFKTNDALGPRLASLNNLEFYQNFLLSLSI